MLGNNKKKRLRHISAAYPTSLTFECFRFFIFVERTPRGNCSHTPTLTLPEWLFLHFIEQPMENQNMQQSLQFNNVIRIEAFICAIRHFELRVPYFIALLEFLVTIC